MDQATVLLITGIFGTIGAIIVALITNLKSIVSALRDENKEDHGRVRQVLDQMSEKIDQVESKVEKIEDKTDHISEKTDFINIKTDHINQKIDNHTEWHADHL